MSGGYFLISSLKFSIFSIGIRIIKLCFFAPSIETTSGGIRLEESGVLSRFDGDKLDPVLDATKGFDGTNGASSISCDAAGCGSEALNFLFRFFGG